MDTNDTAVKAVKDRMLSSHMELETCKGFFRANDLSGVRNIVLLHVSQDNGDKNRFRREIEALTGKPVDVAEARIAIEFGLSDYYKQ